MSGKKRTLAGLSLALALGCQSAEVEEDPDFEATPYTPVGEAEPQTIGYFLAQYDKSLRRWTELKLNVNDERGLRTLRVLEANLNKRAIERQDDLLDVLAGGPPSSREVAAVALGFTDDPTVLGPLLAALSDPIPAVVQKSLLGIGVLGDPETPLSQVEYLLRNHPDSWTRNNAAFAIQRVVSNGGRPPGIREVCLAALIDPEPGVRAQMASVLGILVDPMAIEPLGDLLYDEVKLVSTAAATSLARIGRANLPVKGQVARLLVDAFERAEPPRSRVLHGELVYLCEANLGEEIEPWKEWAYRMP